MDVGELLDPARTIAARRGMSGRGAPYGQRISLDPEWRSWSAPTGFYECAASNAAPGGDGGGHVDLDESD